MHLDANTLGAEVVVIEVIQSGKLIILLLSHRFLELDSKRASTKNVSLFLAQ